MYPSDVLTNDNDEPLLNKGDVFNETFKKLQEATGCIYEENCSEKLYFADSLYKSYLMGMMAD